MVVLNFDSSKLINPHLLLRQEASGAQLIFDLLQSRTNYTPQNLPFRALCKSIKRRRALLCEGIRGGGKTALGEAFAEALGLKLFFLPCVEGLSIEETLYRWDETAQEIFVNQAVRDGMPLAEAQARKWSKQFCKLGTVLEAFDYSATTGLPSVIIVDEVDKILLSEQTFLYQILERGYADVPGLYPDTRIGFSTATDFQPAYPIVFLTSNGGTIAEPLRSRTRYAEIKLPTKAERVSILFNKIKSSVDLLKQVCRLINGIESLPLREPPALREYLDFFSSIVEDRVPAITQDVLLDEISALVKRKEDLITFLGDGRADGSEGALDLLINTYVNKPDPEIDSLILQAQKSAIERENKLRAIRQAA